MNAKTPKVPAQIGQIVCERSRVRFPLLATLFIERIRNSTTKSLVIHKRRSCMHQKVDLSVVSVHFFIQNAIKSLIRNDN